MSVNVEKVKCTSEYTLPSLNTHRCIFSNHNHKSKKCHSYILPRLCEPLWFKQKPYAFFENDLKKRERFKTGRLYRNSQKNKYRTKCPMLNQLDSCPICGPNDFKYHELNNIPQWYLCKEIFSGHMYPCGHYKDKTYMYNCNCDFCNFHHCCQENKNQICWDSIGYNTSVISNLEK
jgi:hypothetical protein